MREIFASFYVGRTALESVGADSISAREVYLPFLHLTPAKIQSFKSVILSERSESQDLGSIGGAKILRLPLVAQDDMF